MFCSSSITLCIFSVVKEIRVPDEEAAEFFAGLRWKYTNTFLKVKAIVRDKVCLEQLKEQIGTHCLDLEDVIESATSTDEVMQQFWKESCKFPYLYELHALVDTLSLAEAEEVIKQYERKQNEVYEKVSAQSFAKIAIEAYDHDNDVKVMCTYFQLGRVW